MEKLIIKNFGAIRDIAIDLKDLTIFIGETGTGKSTLAKLISIFRDHPSSWLDRFFQEKLRYHLIDSFLEESSYTKYQSEEGVFTYEKGKVYWELSESIISKMVKLAQNEEIFLDNKETNLKQSKNTSVLEKLLEIVCNEVIYIPAERSVVSFLSEKYAALDRKELIGLFPKALLDFTGYFNEISFNIRTLSIDLFNVTYQKENGKDYIALSNDKRFLLSESASGLQTLVPTLLIFEYFSQNERKKSYIFEEPELNLFPIAQKLLVELIAEKVLNHGHKMVITTHSPYILTALNNLVYAYQVGQKEPSKVEKLVKRELWLNPQNIASYSVEKGTIRSIVSEELQQTKVEEIDGVSSLINSICDELLEIEVGEENDTDSLEVEVTSDEL
jgi:predicted ATPase